MTSEDKLSIVKLICTIVHQRLCSYALMLQKTIEALLIKWNFLGRVDSLTPKMMKQTLI